MNQPDKPHRNQSAAEQATARAGSEKSEINADFASLPQTGSADAAASPTELLAALQQEMNRLQREIRLAIQAQLGQMSGKSLGSIEANRELAQSIQQMLEAHGLRVRCNQCGQPAILRVSPRSGAAAGVFVFDHTIDGRRTFHGGRNCLPEIRLVAKPARKPRSRKAS